eukprot:CAMPEP_0113481332 /NCGR_PEP_ID=MMETSP0014_2-20120614/22354_1 /TAXON_ID=2857 /ORGANISM="Nitzschia sp." /LENGTH=122 /DNA_ID=CAMNT_0000374825 /DNA_START=3 /DNA_END=368 /DNA_ORIENTATION=+ /assembly_acc=CAM_ASM_000159
MMFKSVVAVLALASTASAFAPIAPQRVVSNTALFLEMGEYDGKLWDNDAKKVVYEKWDPAAARSVNNFNPFETFDGNSPDASGRYPGETGYKDPTRGDVNFQQMMIEREEIEERKKNPKAGD